MTEPDIPGLLRALAEQQTALLTAHAENMRLQRVLIERLTNSAGAVQIEYVRGESSDNTKTTAENHVAADTVAPVAAPTIGDPVDEQYAETIATNAGPEAEVIVAEPAPASEDGAGDRPVLQVVGSTRPRRSDRYYRSAARSSAATANVSPQQLNVLRAIHSLGDVGHLVVMFGPHAGETLGQVAQNDLEYLRELARTAQRADVRAAAARLVAAVPSDPPVHRKPSGPRSRRGR